MKNPKKSSSDKPKKITVLLADDHSIIRESLRNLLSKEKDIEVIAEASDGEEAIRITNEKSPDIVIMDISMPKINGLKATKLIKQTAPDVEILALTVHDDSENILGILEAGAAGYLTKSVFGQEVINAIRSIAAGDSVLTSTILRQILNHAVRSDYQTPESPVNSNLTNRELTVLKLVAKGMSNKDIAYMLNISPLTVKGYLIEIYSKLGVSSRTEAAIKALQAGYFTLGDVQFDE